MNLQSMNQNGNMPGMLPVPLNNSWVIFAGGGGNQAVTIPAGATRVLYIASSHFGISFSGATAFPSSNVLDGSSGLQADPVGHVIPKAFADGTHSLTVVVPSTVTAASWVYLQFGTE